MGRIVRWCRDHAIAVLIPVVLISGFFAYHALQIRIDASAEGMMIQDDPDLDFYHQTLEDFGTDNITIVYIHDDELFTPEKINAIMEVFYQLQDIPGVSRVDSLFNATNFKNEGGFLSTNPLLDWIPEDVAELAQVKADAIHSPLLLRTLISPDGKSMAINVMIEPHSEEPDYHIRITNDIEKTIEPLRGQVDEVFQLGMSYTRKVLAEHILGDQMTLVPLSVLVLLVILVVGLRSANGAIIPCITAGLSILWTVGFMAMLDIPINVLTVIVPSLIIVIGSTEDMHIVSEYFEGLEAGHDRLGAIDYMASKVGVAIFLTALTTYLGFLSIALNKITLLKQFGIAASFGLAANFVVTFSVTPVYLRFFGNKKAPGGGSHDGGEGSGGSFFRRLADLDIGIIRLNKRAIMWTLIIGACLIGIASVRIKVNNDLLAYFKQSSPINVRSRILHQALSGSQNFFIALDGKEEGAFSRPENLQKIFAIQRYLESTGEVDSSLSLADYVALVNREMEGGAPEAYVIPPSADLIDQYLLLFKRYDIERYVTADQRKANIIVRHNISSSHHLKKVLADLRDFMQKTLGEGISFGITGEGILINKAADTMAAGQAMSLSFLLVVIFAIMSFLFLRVKAGFLSLIPNLFPIVVIFGVMGIFDIPLNTGTAMIAAIAIGIAVDDTIHFMVRYNSEMKRLNDQDQAMVECIHSEIRPVLTTSVALVLGFIVLAFSSFVPVIYFGVLSALVMLLALAGDMLLTPILLSSTRLITLWDMLALDLREHVLKESTLFEDMSPWQVKKIVLASHVEAFPKGERIIRQNDVGRVMYLILEGRARVEMEREDGTRAHLQDLGEGEIFGEIALVDAVRRTADVIATEDTRVLAVDWDSLERIRRMFPRISTKLFLNISKILGKRLAATSAQRLAQGEVS